MQNKLDEAVNELVRPGVPRIVESSIGRILHHFDTTGFAVVSASRGTYTMEANEERTRQLGIRIRTDGYTYIPIMGKGREQHPDGTETIASEDAFLVPAKPLYDDAPADLKALALVWGNAFEQTSILFKAPGEPAKEIKCSTGEVLMSMPQFGVKEWADYWLQIVRGSGVQRAKKVAFTETVAVFTNALSFIEGMSRQAAGEIVSLDVFLNSPVRKRRHKP